MIYLIDDKKIRQEKDYKWDINKFEIYKDYIQPIYTLEELKEKSKDIFKESSVILYHESFLDQTILNEDALEKRNKIVEFSNNKNCLIVFFSGSKNTRELSGNIANIPVSILYNNLQVFVDKYSQNDLKLEYLLFGEKFLIEEELSKKLDLALIEAQNQTSIMASESVLVIRPAKKNINRPLLNAVEKTLFNKVTDEDFTRNVKEWLNERVYKQIFLPISFGSTLSDFNGLRLAVHIRTTSTLNQLVPIYIYSYVDLSYLLDNEYFNILKTKNIFLIDYSKYSFENAVKNNVDVFDENELLIELAKIELKTPKNYYDNHSIANEWAIYRWVKTLNITDSEIVKIIQKVQNDLYFKYLQSLYPISTNSVISEKELKIPFSGAAPKILYVDDEADKGWYEIFCNILYDNNQFDFSYLGDELKNISKKEIIDLVFNQVVGNETDLNSRYAITDILLLDFRLHDSDFTEMNIEEITGYKILKKIKEYNPGIQVIVISATNKIWNLQALQDVGVDGFILKENVENSLDQNFTNSSIKSFVNSIKRSTSLIFLKEVFINISSIKNALSMISNKSDLNGFERLEKIKLKNEINIQLDIAYDCLKKSYLSVSNDIDEDYSFFNLSYISLFKIIELINDYYTEDNGSKLKFCKSKIKTFIQRENKFFDYSKDKPYPTTKDKFLNIYENILKGNAIDIFDRLSQIINNRNNIVHPKSLKDYKKTDKDENLDMFIFINEVLCKIT